MSIARIFRTHIYSNMRYQYRLGLFAFLAPDVDLRIDARAEVPAVQVHQVCDHVQRRCAADHKLRVPEHARTWACVPVGARARVRACVSTR